jgi:LacI family transcriptional regulator
MAIVGFGDEMIASLIEPSLTVYHHSPFQMGGIAAKMLIDNIIHKDTFQPELQQMKGKLIIRQSSVRQ